MYSVRLQLVSPAASIPINVSIFSGQLGQQGSLSRHVTTSGPYTDAKSGVVTPRTQLQKGNYFIVPSTYKTGVEAQFRVVAYTSQAVKITEPGS